MKLKWSGRATQAAPIPDSEWEKHKAVICHLRPKMSLECLMVIMARDHKFTASRPQYKSRFQKWQLPNLRAISAMQEIQDLLPGTQQDSSFHWPLPHMSESDYVVEDSEQFIPAPIAEPTVDDSVMESTSVIDDKPISLAASITTFGDLEDNKGRKTPKSEQVCQSCGNVFPQPVVHHPSCCHGLDKAADGTEALAPQDLLNAMEHGNAGALPSVQDLESICNAAHFLFAAGSYHDSHDLYAMHWRALLESRHRSLPSLVSAAVNVARSAYSATQLRVAKQAIERLMQDFKEDLKKTPTAQFTLRAQVADILRKWKLYDQAAVQCVFALHATFGWGYDSGNIPKDRRGPAFLLRQCCMQVSQRYKAPADDASTCACGPGPHLCWRTDAPHDETLRLVFTWCARRLLDSELHRNLSEAFGDIQAYVTDETAAVRELNTVLFCHLWEAFSEASTSGDPEEHIVESVDEIRDAMGISAPEIFATVSIALLKLAPRWLVHCLPTYSTKPSWHFSYTAHNLMQVQMRALNLDSAHSSHADFIEAFLKAYATLSTAQTPTRTLDAKPINASVKKHSRISLSVFTSQDSLSGRLGHQWTVPNAAPETAFRRASCDPTLLSTPRSSLSSGFASMLALRWKIAQEKNQACRSGDSSVFRPSQNSLSSSSFRHHRGLSIASYQTLSTNDGDSLVSSGMDWEPIIGTINEVTAR